MINTKEDRENLFVNLAKKATIVEHLKPMLNQGYHFTGEGRLEPFRSGLMWDTPWVYTQAHHRIRCEIGHRIVFDRFGFVSNICRNCYKVVVRPRTVVELFDLYELQREMGVPCKCGIEVREYVHGLYGGYFYCRGKEEGLKRYKQVRKLVDEQISPDVPVILKRYCTEFEIGPGSFGPSDKLPPLTPEQEEIEKTLIALIPDENNRCAHVDLIIAYTMKKWIMFAHANNDPTYKELTGGQPLFPSVVTYHQEVEENDNGNP